MNDRDKLVEIAAKLDALQADIAAHLEPVIEPPPPDPVECVLSDWSAWESASAWSPCVDGQQTRTERRTRTVVVEPANGGAPCGPLEETREVSRSCVPPVVDPEPRMPTVDELMARTLPEGYLDGLGYPERRHIIQSQGHELMAHDPEGDQRHIHGMLSRPLMIRGIAVFDLELLFFHCFGMTLTGVSVTWRGGGSVLYPSPAKPAKNGVWNVPLTEHIQRQVVSFAVDTRSDPFDGRRALEIDVEILRPEDGRKANTRMLAGTIEVMNGRESRRDVGGVFGTEYWISPADGEASPFGYGQVSVSGVRFWEGDPSQPIVLSGQGRDPQRQTLAKAFVNPNMHAHPPDYGRVLLEDTQLPSKTSAAGSTKWGSIVLPAPDLAVGDKLACRVIDTGRALDGTIVVPEGGGGSLFFAHLMPGSRPAGVGN